eukprot:gene3591-13678_t
MLQLLRDRPVLMSRMLVAAGRVRDMQESSAVRRVADPAPFSPSDVPHKELSVIGGASVLADMKGGVAYHAPFSPTDVPQEKLGVVGEAPVPADLNSGVDESAPSTACGVAHKELCVIGGASVPADMKGGVAYHAPFSPTDVPHEELGVRGSSASAGVKRGVDKSAPSSAYGLGHGQLGVVGGASVPADVNSGVAYHAPFSPTDVALEELRVGEEASVPEDGYCGVDESVPSSAYSLGRGQLGVGGGASAHAYVNGGGADPAPFSPSDEAHEELRTDHLLIPTVATADGGTQTSRAVGIKHSTNSSSSDGSREGTPNNSFIVRHLTGNPLTTHCMIPAATHPTFELPTVTMADGGTQTSRAASINQGQALTSAGRSMAAATHSRREGHPQHLFIVQAPPPPGKTSGHLQSPHNGLEPVGLPKAHHNPSTAHSTSDIPIQCLGRQWGLCYQPTLNPLYSSSNLNIYHPPPKALGAQLECTPKAPINPSTASSTSDIYIPTQCLRPSAAQAPINPSTAHSTSDIPIQCLGPSGLYQPPSVTPALVNTAHASPPPASTPPPPTSTPPPKVSLHHLWGMLYQPPVATQPFCQCRTGPH